MINNKIVQSVILVFSLIFIFSGSINAQSAQPTKLEVRAEGNIVHLKWQAPDADSKLTYNVYRASASSLTVALEPDQLDFSRLNTVTVTEYDDNIQSISSEGNLYVYYVAAVNNDGTESAGSNYVNIKVSDTKTEMKSE